MSSYIPFGNLTPEIANRMGMSEGRVFLDGVDVTADCKELDDIEGWVVLIKRGPEGHHFLDDSGKVARETKHGIVQFILPEPVA